MSSTEKLDVNFSYKTAVLQLTDIHCLVQRHFGMTAACQAGLERCLTFATMWNYQSGPLSPPSLPSFQVLSAFQAQHTAAAAAQPQLLIPLSSIPSYSAAMDTNPLLGSTYKKFPYPSMAEISSLAAQTQFTEEQIKVDESCFGLITCARKGCCVVSFSFIR